VTKSIQSSFPTQRRHTRREEHAHLNRISMSYECHELKGKAFSPIVNSIRAYDTSPRSATRGRPCSVPYTRRTTQLRLSISSTAQDLLWRIHPFAGLRKTKRCMFLQRHEVAMRRKQTISGFVSKQARWPTENCLIVIVGESSVGETGLLCPLSSFSICFNQFSRVAAQLKKSAL